MADPVRITVTGAAGQIGYAILPRIIAGDVLGPDTPIILQLLEITPAMGALKGVCMELADMASPLLHGVVLTDDPEEAFKDADIAFLVGAFPRKKGMDRSDLLNRNAEIFVSQGKAINKAAKRDIKVLVVGNPANTNCLIAMNNAPDIAKSQWTAMTRLDHNRAMGMLAEKAGCQVRDIKRMTVWGNHSNTQYPDITNTTIGGKAVLDVVSDHEWLRGDYIKKVSTRGGAIIEARGLSSAASAAHAALVHMHDWVNGTPEGDWVSMAVCSDGSYDVPEGLISSFPCTCKDGAYEIVQGLDVDDFGRGKLQATIDELASEREVVKELLG